MCRNLTFVRETLSAPVISEPLSSSLYLTWQTAPSLSTFYLDKPLKAHTLMQAIARANRVNERKNNDLIVDYGGILKSLRKALATFAGESGEGGAPQEVDPVRPEEELLDCLFFGSKPSSSDEKRLEPFCWRID
jgi:hypothetical protein